MKKLILLFNLFISFTFYAQNVEYMAEIRNLDENGAIEVAKEIADLSRGNFEVALQKETKKGYNVTMVRKGIDYNKIADKLDEYPNDFFIVSFEKYFEGQNKALEIEGVKKYRFHRVVFNYLDLFPYWQKYFSTEATPEKTIEDFKLRESRYKNNEVHWLYKFKEVSNGSKRWELNKFY
ncbi:MAG TPA: hypothetical protein VLY87_01330 [Flavobacterium sp.]|nr:hypothetical protein [Flavobacterium sp.]